MSSGNQLRGVPEQIDLIAREDELVQVGATPFEELGLGNLRDARFVVEEEDEFESVNRGGSFGGGMFSVPNDGFRTKPR